MITKIWFATFVLLCGLGNAHADYNMSSTFNANGLTIFSSLFYVGGGQEGYMLEGLVRDARTPLVFICGTPGAPLNASGSTIVDARLKFVEVHADCFTANGDGTVKVSGPKGLVFPEKNLAACRCTPKQIDSYLLDQACQNSGRFVTTDAVTKACASLGR